MSSSKDTLLDFTEDFIKNFQKESTGALFDWNHAKADEFSRVSIETLITDSYFLGFKDKVYDGVLEDIIDLFEERKKRQVNLAIFLEGIGSGKTVKASIIEWLIWYEITMCQPSPQEYFDLAPNSVIALINLNRCITGDSYIYSNQGIKRIDSFFNQDHIEKTSEKINNLISASSIGPQKVDELYFNGFSKVKKIRLSNGLEIAGTFNHPVKVAGGYSELKDLSLGDEVICQYNQQLYGNNLLITPDLAYVLGVLIGDGQLGHPRKYIKWCSSKDHSEHSDYCIDIINKYFGNGFNYVSKQDYPDRNVFIYSVQFEGRKRFRELLDSIGMNTKGDFKEVPTCILEAPKEVQVEFIRGLFDTDGTSDDSRPRIRYTSISKLLVFQVQLMLLNMGILCRVRKHKRKRDKKHPKDSWNLTINGAYCEKFLIDIGFFIQYKNDKIIKSLQNKTRDFYTKENIIDSNHYFCSIVDIEEYDDLTFDFSMSKEPNFVANGILNHNTEKQAKRVTFTEVWNRFQSPFNKDYFPPTDRFTTEIRIPRNNTTIFPGTSSALSALGYNLYGGVIDEAAFLEVVDDSSKTFDGRFDAAEEMYHAIMNRMVSRFLRKGHLPGLLCMISSPNFPDDFLHKQIEYATKVAEESKKLGTTDNSGIFWRRRPTWEAKGKKFFQDDEFFYIDTTNAEIMDDPMVIKFLNYVAEKNFPLKVDGDVLFKIAQYLKDELPTTRKK